MGVETFVYVHLRADNDDTFQVSGTLRLRDGEPFAADFYAWDHDEMTQTEWISEIEKRLASLGHKCRVLDEVHAGNGHYMFQLTGI